MKTLFPIILLLSLIACDKSKDVDPKSLNGCQSGYNPAGQYVFIRCRTRGEAQADGQTFSVSNGSGSSQTFMVYKGCKWEACSTCK